MTPTPAPGQPTAPDPASSPTDNERLADLAEEFSQRHRRGERPTIDEYVLQYPELADQIRDLFPAMVLMEGPGINPAPGQASEHLGTMVGRYKLLERLGEGGFGVVFMAEQLSPVRRRVALKVIKPGLDTQQVIDRFQAERQTLALMDHENIARVLDAGATDAGRPYFVMELVEGVPITDYCDRHQLATELRLRLFVQVCRAVQHAHTKGIIHRDLKPTNILVAVHDGLPVPKVIDFGVAKATGLQQLADGTLFTSVAQIVGTPLYMSPEQAEMSGQDVDTRSDVYSLGAVLYELLTGTTPVDKDRLKKAAFDEVRRIIREEEPPRPSTRISTLSGRLPAASADRRGDLKKLGQLVRGELDWIVMKALEKDRNRRYDTVSGLATDVDRYLNDETVHACPPSATYRIRKLLRRHKGPVVAASLLALALVGGIVGTTFGMLRATDQQYLALVSQAHAERSSSGAGQRFGALETVMKAARIRVTPELRAEAAAALALPDMELAQEWDDADPNGELTVSFDGDTIHYARVSQKGEVTIGRVTGGREVAGCSLAAHGKSLIRGPWWSGDRRFLAYGHSGTEDGAGFGLRVWKLDGPTPVVVVDEPPAVNMSAFAFDGSGQKCAVAHARGGVSVYDLDTGRPLRQLPVGNVAALAFHPRDGRLAVACGAVVQIFDCDTGVESKRLRPVQTSDPIGCIAWHPEGRRLAAGSINRIHVFDADSAAEILPPWVNRANVDTIVFNHSGDRLLSWDWSMQTLLWNPTSREPLLASPYELHPNATFSPDDRLVGFSRVSRSDGGKIRVWRVARGRELLVLDNPGNRMEMLQGGVMDPSGRILAVGSVMATLLCFFDTATGENLATVRVPANSARPFAFDPVAGGWLTGGTRGVLLWPLRSIPGGRGSLRVGPPQVIFSSAATEGAGSGNEGAATAPADARSQLPGPREPGAAEFVPAVAPPPLASGIGGSLWGDSGASRDARVLAISDVTSTLLIDRGGAHAPLTLALEGRVRGSVVSPDGKWVVTCTVGSNGPSSPVRIWNGEDGLPVADLLLSGTAWWAAFSPDGRWLATHNRSESQLWKVGTWEPVRPLAGMCVFSPDEELMAVNDLVGTIRLVKIASDEEVARISGPERSKYWPQCFSPDGTRLIAMGQGLCMWDLRLIRGQLRARGLDWDLKPFPPEDQAPKGRIHLTVDTGMSAEEASDAHSTGPREPESVQSPSN